jgi:hypothetical protein
MAKTLTVHGGERLQQRSIPPVMIEYLERFGSEVREGKSYKLFFDHAARRRLHHHLGRLFRDFERWTNVYAVFNDQGQMVTAGYRTKGFNSP